MRQPHDAEQIFEDLQELQALCERQEWIWWASTILLALAAGLVVYLLGHGFEMWTTVGVAVAICLALELGLVNVFRWQLARMVERHQASWEKRNPDA